MKRVLIVATTSYAGMGPYVSGIVNTFLPNDDVYYFFHDYDDLFFRKNVKEELHSRSTFYKSKNERKKYIVQVSSFYSNQTYYWEKKENKQYLLFRI
jgi:hypothetical protein